MKYLVILIYSLLCSAVNIEVTWEDIINFDKDCYTDYWYNRDFVDLELYSVSVVNVRVRADSNSTKLGIIKTGELVKVTAITDNGWYEVLYNGKRGYIKSEYLTEMQSTTPLRYNNFVYYVGEGEKATSGVAKYWSLIPDFIRTEFESDNSKLIITDENLGSMFYNDADLSVLGITSFYPSRNNCELYVSSEERAHYAVIHEIGHYVDGKMQFPSESNEFKSIWGSEKSFISIFHSTNIENVNKPSEYFAESFNLFITKSDDLNQYCPLTHSYIKKVLDDFKQKYGIIID